MAMRLVFSMQKGQFCVWQFLFFCQFSTCLFYDHNANSLLPLFAKIVSLAMEQVSVLLRSPAIPPGFTILGEIAYVF